MPIRPPRAGLSVARRLSEQARAARAASGADSGLDLAGAGGVSGILDALCGLVGQLAQAAAGSAGTTADAHGISPGEGRASVVFGYTLKLGPDGISAERFGDMPDPPARRAAPAPVAAPPARQPIVDVFEEDGAIVVVAELPGADADRIVCRPEGPRLVIEAAGARRYRKTVDLPAAVRPQPLQQSFRNGILEVRLARADAPDNAPDDATGETP